MTRPLMRHSINKLEEMFFNSPTDSEVLKQLKQELEHRNSRQAAALLERVQLALNSAGKKIITAPVSSPNKPKAAETLQMAALWEAPSEFKSVASNDVALSGATRVPANLQNEPSASHASPEPPPQIPLSEAYKILKSTPDTAWLTIEQNRRRLVSDSNPIKPTSLSLEKRRATLENAKAVNAACLIIWNARYNKT